MDENHSSASVYDLTTKLCEKFVTPRQTHASSKVLKKLRSRAYEMLLSKRLPDKGDVMQLENNNDPFCHLLAWRFDLINKYDLPEHASKLQNCVDILQKSNVLSDGVLKDILYILLQLRKNPKSTSVVYVSGPSYSCHSFSSSSGTCFRYFDESKFKLQLPMICAGSKFSDQSFYLKTKQNSKRLASSRANYFNLDKEACKSCAMFPNRISCKSSENVVKEDEGYESPTKDESDIWDIVSNSKFTELRTWESLGNPIPDTEPPFLTESSPEVCSWLYELQSLQVSLMHDKLLNVCMRKVIPQKEFIRDVKFLLVGMSSKSFRCDVNGNLGLVQGTCVEGVTCAAVASYCKDLIFCGTCYKVLSEMCAADQFLVEKRNQGFIFRELCESIKRYLSYYRVATLSISENSNLLTIHEHMRQLQAHLDVLATVCKVGPFAESEQLPNGVALLNYLYQKVTSLSNKDVIMVLYSVLYPCVQVYFSRFLQQWIFEGIVNDPYNEFFVHPNQKYLSTRGRTYWTRSYTVQEDIVPDFLTELRDDILVCGKAMNLLKLCMPSSPLCMYLMGKKPSLLSCCLTSDQLKVLEQNASCYYLEVIAECGPKFTFSDVVARSYEQNIIFMNLITKKRAATLKRLELEKLKKMQEESERKYQRMADLKLQYDLALQQKRIQTMEEIEKEMMMNETNLKMHNLREKLIQEEANTLIEYYNNLNDILEQKRVSIEKHIKRLKNQSGVEKPISNIKCAAGAGQSAAVDVQPSTEELQCNSNKADETSSSSETYLTVSSDTPRNSNDDTLVEVEEAFADIPNSDSLDVMNANSEVFYNTLEKPEVNGPKQENLSETATIAVENFEIARRNKVKVLSIEMGISITEQRKPQNIHTDFSELSALQRNRLKMMTSEFGIDMRTVVEPDKDLTIVEINRRKNMNHTEFGGIEDVIKKDLATTQVGINRHKNMNHTEFGSSENFVKKDLAATQVGINRCRNMSHTKFGSIEDFNEKDSASTQVGINRCRNMSHTEFGSTENFPTTEVQIYSRKNVNHAEFGRIECFIEEDLLTEANKTITVSNIFHHKKPTTLIISKCDNENFLNSNIGYCNKNEIENKNNEMNGNTEVIEECQNDKKPLENNEKENIKINNLKLDFSKIMQVAPSVFTRFLKSPNFELEKPIPMSVDSTPCTEVTSETPKMLMSMERLHTESSSAVTTAATNFTDEGFPFVTNERERTPILCTKMQSDKSLVEKMFISKRVSIKDAMGVSTSCLKQCIQESVAIPVKTQMKIVNNELLKFFINDLQYLMHLNSLRNYFFLLDGEFGRNITEGLFEKLYDVNFPVDLINCRTLQHLVYRAMDSSIKLQENSNCVSFKINNLPKTFDLGSPDVLDCLSLTYKVVWPLNILLPSDTIGKYDEVFKFLLKLHRVSWVLKKIFQELKILAKETGRREPFLMMSPQFQKLHQCRHVMTHFIQTLQNYVVGEVLQTSWDIFEKNLVSVTNLDQLYALHTTYIKNILFMCLLNQKCAPIRRAIHNIFVIILKFYDYLRTKAWHFEEDDGFFVHPNFKKLEDIFLNFEEFVMYLYKAGQKVAKAGYQPHLVQLLDMLNVNDYYTKKNVSRDLTTSC